MPLGQGHVSNQGGSRGSRTPKAVKLVPRPIRHPCRSVPGGVPSPVGLYFRKAAAAGIEPATGRLTATYPYQHGTHRITSVRTVGFEPTISCSRGTRNARLSHVLNPERPAGVEPALPPWQGGRLPLHHGRLVGNQVVKDRESTGRDSNPRRRITKAVSSPLDHRCLLLSVGLVGIEPTSSGLRDRCIALSATIPVQSARWESNPRPASYKDAALTTELRASSASRAGGNRTHTCRIKSPVCCLLHHDPMLGRAYPFQSTGVQHRSAPCCSLFEW